MFLCATATLASCLCSSGSCRQRVLPGPGSPGDQVSHRQPETMETLWHPAIHGNGRTHVCIWKKKNMFVYSVLRGLGALHTDGKVTFSFKDEPSDVKALEAIPHHAKKCMQKMRDMNRCDRQVSSGLVKVVVFFFTLFNLQQISGNCNTTILHTPERYSYLYSYDCTLVPGKTMTAYTADCCT